MGLMRKNGRERARPRLRANQSFSDCDDHASELRGRIEGKSDRARGTKNCPGRRALQHRIPFGASVQPQKRLSEGDPFLPDLARRAPSEFFAGASQDWDPGFARAAKGPRGKKETNGRKARFGSRTRDAVAGTTKTELCQREIASARFGN